MLFTSFADPFEVGLGLTVNDLLFAKLEERTPVFDSLSLLGEFAAERPAQHTHVDTSNHTAFHRCRRLKSCNFTTEKYINVQKF